MNTTKKLMTLLMALLTLTSCNSDENDVKETRVTPGDLMSPYFLNGIDQYGFWTFSGTEAAYGSDVSDNMTEGMKVKCDAFYSSWSLDNGLLILDGSEIHKISRLEPAGGYIIKIDDAQYLPSTNAKHGNIIDKYLMQSGFTKQMLMDAMRESFETDTIVVIKWY